MWPFIWILRLLSSSILVRYLFAYNRYLSKTKYGLKASDKLLAFFHPYCDAGGGGERVLWVLICSLLQNNSETAKKVHMLIYSGEGAKSKEAIIDNVKSKFSLEFTKEQAERLHFVNINSRTLLEPKWYPIFTMLGQSLASILVGFECLFRATPDIYCDTMGAAFVYPVAKMFAGCRVVAYVHYPIISSDMLRKVREQRPTYNNNSAIASNNSVSSLKVLYYQIFALMYQFVGVYGCDIAVTNGSWTEAHIKKMWKGCKRILKVYPPCNTAVLLAAAEKRNASITGSTKQREHIMVSIGQYRPEKDHILQVRYQRGNSMTRLVIIGSVRNADDEAVAESVKEEIRRCVASSIDDFNFADHVELIVNAPYATLVDILSKARVGLHSMWNEHFGISVVEMVAAGLVVIAHQSGGPYMDIIKHPRLHQAPYDEDIPYDGYLASTVDQYAWCMKDAFDNYAGDSDRSESTCSGSSIVANGTAGVQRFSDELFSSSMWDLVLRKELNR